MKFQRRTRKASFYITLIYCPKVPRYRIVVAALLNSSFINLRANMAAATHQINISTFSPNRKSISIHSLSVPGRKSKSQPFHRKIGENMKSTCITNTTPNRPTCTCMPKYTEIYNDVKQTYMYMYAKIHGDL